MQQLYPNFIHQILPVDEIAKSINYLNSKQREVLMWLIHGPDVEPEHIFISDSEETGKPYFMTVIYSVH